MQAFLDFVVKGLVDRPDAVSITPVERNGMTIFELRVHPTDMGKIIGRQGATINAIRALLLVGSAKRGIRCALEVIDEEGGGERRERSERSDRGERGGPNRGRGRDGRGGGGGFRERRSDSGESAEAAGGFQQNGPDVEIPDDRF
ncbi:MAG: KH domain-containing protein [Verrucomicrobiota bacterium]